MELEIKTLTGQRLMQNVAQYLLLPFWPKYGVYGTALELLYIESSVTRKNRQMSIKVAQK